MNRKKFTILLILTGISLFLLQAQEYDNAQDPVVRAVQKALPSVVSILTQDEVIQNNDPFAETFKNFYGMYQPSPMFLQKKLEQIKGSGVIVDQEGYIVTNQHNIRRVQSPIQVVLSNGDTYPAEFLIGDERNDLALLKITPKSPLPAIGLANPEDLLLGQTVLALGNPFGLPNSVTKGILSSKGRDVRVEGKEYEELLQTDAAINPGNSGGALVDLNGRLIGVNVLVLARGQGIGFAIPVNKITDTLSKFLSLEKRNKVSLGLLFASSKSGIEIRNVEPGSPADGLFVKGEHILNVDDKPFSSLVQMQGYLLTKKAGDQVKFTVNRAKGPQSVLVTLKPYTTPAGAKLAKSKLGITVQELNPTSARQNGYNLNDGLIISDVEADSPAAKVGIKRGMVLVKIDGKDARKIDDFEDLLGPVKGGANIKLAVVFLQQVAANAVLQRTAEATIKTR